jgi:hypothetical protein
MSTFGKFRVLKFVGVERQLWAYSVERLCFLANSENICPHSSNEDSLLGIQLKWASGSIVTSWSLLWQSSQSFSKDVLWAEVLKISIWGFSTE